MKKIVVIGSGIMGSGIAEQIANSGHQVHLLDIVPDNSIDRNILAKQAIAKSTAIFPENIIPGNLEDDIAEIASADWIIEVIIEKLHIKQTLYQKLEQYCDKHCIISSNTSTITLKELIKGRTENFKKHFFITHFFNPPRHMPLLELISSAYNSLETIQKIANFIDIYLGKTIVISNDTPGFIANRIGCYFLETSLSYAIETAIDIEEVDELMSQALDIPKTGVFGLYDLIGLDVMHLICESLKKNLNPEDNFHKISKAHPMLLEMINNGYTGRKGKGGFYRIIRDINQRKIKQSLDLQTGEYRSVRESCEHNHNLKDLLDSNVYFSKVITQTLAYAAKLIPEVSDNIFAIDQAMKLGYNWKFGPFELIDKIGIELFKQKLLELNIPLPQLIENAGNQKFYDGKSYFNGKHYSPITYPNDIIFLNEFYPPIYKNDSAQILNLGDGVAAIEFTSKMAVANHNVFNMILDFFDQYAHKFKAVIIANAQPNFSVGGDLKFMLEMAEEQNFSAIEEYLKLGQTAMHSLKHSSIPVISALKGMALGGGSEILLHSHAIISHIETNSGLVEAGVGLIPGWGGCKELILRTKTVNERIQAFKNIINGKTSSSAHELKAMLHLNDLQICMNANRILEQSKKKASITIEIDKQLLNTTPFTVNYDSIVDEYYGHSRTIAKNLAELFNYKDVNEALLLEQERNIFIKLLETKPTQERIKYMLKYGKRLRN